MKTNKICRTWREVPGVRLKTGEIKVNFIPEGVYTFDNGHNLAEICLASIGLTGLLCLLGLAYIVTP